MGDTVKGNIPNVEEICRILRKISNEYGIETPPTVVDAAGQYLFLSMMKNSEEYDSKIPNWDFQVEDVVAIICDPHKNQIPYSTGLILFRDVKDTLYTNVKTSYLSRDMLDEVGSLSEDEKKDSQVMATIPTSRGGYGPAATWAYYMKYGFQGLKRKKENIWKVTKEFKKLIEASENYQLVCEPQTTNVVFKLNGTFSKCSILN